MDVARFDAIIRDMLATDDAQRKPAEQAFEDLKTANPNGVVLMLLTFARSHADNGVKLLSLTQFRRLVVPSSGDTVWDSLPPATHETIKQALLEHLAVETLSVAQRQFADVLADVGGPLVRDGLWPELLPWMFRNARNEAPHVRAAALIAFAQVAASVETLLRAHLGPVRDVLREALLDGALAVKLAGLSGCLEVIQLLEHQAEWDLFQPLLPDMMQVLSLSLQDTDDINNALEALDIFISLVEEAPAFARSQLSMLLEYMLQLAASPQFDAALRHLAMEFVVTAAEKRPASVRKIDGFLMRVLPLVLQMMMTIDDTPLDQWNALHDTAEDDTPVTSRDVGDESLDRLCLALGGKVVAPMLFGFVQQLQASDDWRQRHTALMAVALSAEGCARYLELYLEEVVRFVAALFQDAHPRVRWAAAHTLGQLSADLGPDFQRRFHATVLPCLMQLCASDLANPRVVVHAVASLINFTEKCPSDVLTPYLPALSSTLVALFKTGHCYIQEQVVTSVASIADCSKEEFLQYYDTFMGYLKHILATASGKDYRLLRGKTMESISLVGLAIGPEKFEADAQEVMSLLATAQSKPMDPDDPEASFMMQAWVRICNTLGEKFVPYLGFVLPPVIAAAAADLRVAVGSGDMAAAAAAGQAPQTPGWEWVPLGDEASVGINTTAMEEKATACNMLFCYCAELGRHFAPWVRQVADIMIPLMKFEYSDGVRSAAAEIAPYLLRSVREHLQDELGQDPMPALVELAARILPYLTTVIVNEKEYEVLILQLGALHGVIEAMGDNALTPAQLDTVVRTAEQQLLEFMSRRNLRLTRQRDEDFDEDEAQRIEDENFHEEDCLVQLAELIGKLIRLYRGAFLERGTQIMQYVGQFLEPANRAHDRQIALCLFDDVIENCGELAYGCYPTLLPLLLTYSADEDPGVRQAAVYGLGCIAQTGFAQFDSMLPTALERLCAVINAPNSRKESADSDDVAATENAICAVGKFIKFQPHRVDVPTLLSQWLSWLPVTNDTSESVVTYSLLCDLVEQESTRPLILAALPRLVAIFGHIIDTNLIDEPVHARIVAILQNLHATLPPAVLAAAWESITPEMRVALHAAVQP